MLGGPCPDHRIGVDDGIAFGPGDRLARRRRGIQQIGRAGERRLRPHLHIGIRFDPGRHLRFEHVETLDDLVHSFTGKGNHGCGR